MMTSEQFARIKTLAADFVQRARATGAVIADANSVTPLFSALSLAARMGHSARGFDRARAFDVDRLNRLKQELDTLIIDGSLNTEEKSVIKKMRAMLDDQLRGSDADRLRGRAQRDMDSPPARNAFRSWEPGMTGQDRAHLRRSRELARAADRRVAIPFLGAPPAAGSDMEAMEAQAAESFGLLD